MESDEPRNEICLTPEMVQAGMDAFWMVLEGIGICASDPGELVTLIYSEMVKADKDVSRALRELRQRQKLMVRLADRVRTISIEDYGAPLMNENP